MRARLLYICLLFLAVSASATVRVFVEDVNGKAFVKYECTSGETIRAFALDVTVDQGTILAASDFFRGESTAAARGYGIFPASFRDHITVVSGTNVNWNVTEYIPVAAVADRPGDTQPGLNSAGVTLEFGALWNPNVPAAAPDPSGTLCALQLSEPALVSISANQARGGLVSAFPENIIVPVFSSAAVDPSVVITGITFANGVLTIAFKGGELESAPGVNGPWTGTGNTSGTYNETLGAASAKFYRVHNH